MFILDTNVLSALMKDQPEQAVTTWLDQQAPESIWLTTITVFEVRLGLALLAEGRRRTRLTALFDALLAEDLSHHVLDFDRPAADAAAALAARRQRSGTPVDMRDTQIAGIAIARRAAIVTRNVRHFADVGLPVINPWSAA